MGRARFTGHADLLPWPPGAWGDSAQSARPGAQLRITDHDGMRITGLLTNTAPTDRAPSALNQPNPPNVITATEDHHITVTKNRG